MEKPLNKYYWLPYDFYNFLQENRMGLEYEELTEKIIGAAIEVHKKLGPGFMESVK